MLLNSRQITEPSAFHCTILCVLMAAQRQRDAASDGALTGCGSASGDGSTAFCAHHVRTTPLTTTVHTGGNRSEVATLKCSLAACFFAEHVQSISQQCCASP